MKNKWKRILVFCAAAVILSATAAGCGKNPSSADPSRAGQSLETGENERKENEDKAEEGGKADDVRGEIVLAAAASLKNVFDDRLIPAFEEKYPGAHVTATYDSSGKLMTQIEEGLAADLFFCAAPKQMNELVEKNFVMPEDVTKLLENRIVLIAGKDTDLSADSFLDAETIPSFAIGDPASVPAGQYAKQVLENAGVWDKIKDKVSLGTNVTEVLNWVDQGSADAGIVYSTDAASRPGVKVLLAADKGLLPSPPVYPVGKLKNGSHPKGAQAFYDYLQSEEALLVFEEYGFIRHEAEEKGK